MDTLIDSAATSVTSTDDTGLRRVLAINATTSGLGGAAALVLGGHVATLLGTDRVGWVRAVGAGLVGFAIVVASLSRSSHRRLRAEAPLVSAGDLAWVVGTVVTIALGWYSTRGSVVMGAVASMVGTFGVAQWMLSRRSS